MLGLNRDCSGLTTERSTRDRIINVQFADFMRAPFATISTIYERLGRELTPTAETFSRAKIFRPTPATAAVTATPGPTPDWTRTNFARRCGPTRNASMCPARYCARSRKRGSRRSAPASKLQYSTSAGR